MYWKECVLEELKNYQRLKFSVLRLTEKIQALDEKATAPKTARMDGMPAAKGKTMADWLVENLMERELLKARLAATERTLAMVDAGLELLPEEERQVLEVLYLDRRPLTADAAALRMHCDRSTVYRLRDRALTHYCVAAYGLVAPSGVEGADGQ